MNYFIKKLYISNKSPENNESPKTYNSNNYMFKQYIKDIFNILIPSSLIYTLIFVVIFFI